MKRKLLICGMLVIGASAEARANPSLTTLAHLDLDVNGASPMTPLIFDPAGNLYGPTSAGGSPTFSGAIFEVTAGTHSLLTLATFTGANGISPQGNLLRDAAGNLYGTTVNGGANTDPANAPNGYGTAFELPVGTHTANAIASFDGTHGAFPSSGLISDSAGNMYGAANSGGANNFGTVFKISAVTHTLTTLASFDSVNGAYPLEGLISDSDGNLFGTSQGDGTTNAGTVFELPSGSHTITALATFNGTNGEAPFAGLVADSHGNLYGTTFGSGVDESNGGTIYEVAADTHLLTTLASFSGANGAFPDGTLLLDANGNLFGTTAQGGAHDDGTLFEIDPETDALTTLISFDATTGQLPRGGLVADAAGNIYGTTTQDGPDGGGTVFELSGTDFVPIAPVPEPGPLSLLCMSSLGLIYRSRKSSRPR